MPPPIIRVKWDAPAGCAEGRARREASRSPGLEARWMMLYTSISLDWIQ